MKYSKPVRGNTRGSREKKYFDSTVDEAVLSSMMTIKHLTAIPLGIGDGQRVGSKLTVLNIYWKYLITLKTTAEAADIVNLMVVHDTKPDSGTFTATDLLEADATDPSRFQVLMCEDFDMWTRASMAEGHSAHLSTNEHVQHVTGGEPCNIVIEFDDDGTVRNNNLYWITQASAGICNGIGTIRLRYKEK